MHGCQDRLAAIKGRVDVAIGYLLDVQQSAGANSLADDEAAREALALVMLEVEGIRKIFDAPVLATGRPRETVTSTIPASP
jgi:hypothetical protein